MVKVLEENKTTQTRPYRLYHLVDEVQGVGNSRRVIYTATRFQEMKEYLEKNKEQLYNVLPDVRNNAPTFSHCRSYKELKNKLESTIYYNWRLNLIRTENHSSYKRHIRQAIHNKRSWVFIRPLRSFRGNQYLGNGVRADYLSRLTNEESTIIQHASLYRVLHTKQGAVLVEWSGHKGTATTWVSNQYI